MAKGESSRMDNLELYQLEYDLKEKQFYVVFKNSSRISINELRFESHELHWKERKFVDSILEWLQEQHPETLI